VGVAEMTATGWLLAVTVMDEVAVLDPSWVVTVTVAVPAETPVTTPVALTVATEVLPEDQVTFLLVALAGATVAVQGRGIARIHGNRGR
jgi:putative effector of murein hydrolase